MASANLGEVVRANVAQLFGRFRPPAGMSESEIKGVKAERVEFAQRLVTMLKVLDAPASKIIRELREVCRELMNQPFTMRMPTADGIAGSVRERVQREVVHPPCPICSKLTSAPGIYADSARGPVERSGTLRLEGEWWCADHYRILSWISHRQGKYEDGIAWPYPPPMLFFPKAAFHDGARAHPDEIPHYTDGHLMSEDVLAVREAYESMTGTTILDRPKLHAV